MTEQQQTVQSPSNSPEVPFPLMILPAEIRNQIYEILLIHSEPINLTVLQSGSATAMVPGCHLLQASRQLHKEATSILYSRNTFVFWGPAWDVVGKTTFMECIASWLENLGRSENLVKKVIVSVDQTWIDSARRRLPLLPVLRRLWARAVPDLILSFCNDDSNANNTYCVTLNIPVSQLAHRTHPNLWRHNIGLVGIKDEEEIVRQVLSYSSNKA